VEMGCQDTYLKQEAGNLPSVSWALVRWTYSRLSISDGGREKTNLKVALVVRAWIDREESAATTVLRRCVLRGGGKGEPPVEGTLGLRKGESLVGHRGEIEI